MSGTRAGAGCVLWIPAHTEAVPDDDDRPQDGSRAADTPWVDVVVPDDLRELSRDIAAYRREVRRADRARRMRTLLTRRGVLPALVLAGALLLAGVVATMLLLMSSRTVGRAPTALPLAAPTQAQGSVGGLLPAARLRGPDGYVSTRSTELRPTVLALIGTNCDCRDLLNALAGQAYSENLRLAIVVPAASDPSAAALPTLLDRGEPSVYYDASGTLATAVSRSTPPTPGITIVLVNRDGRIYDIETGVIDPTKTTLDAALQSMLHTNR